LTVVSSAPIPTRPSWIPIAGRLKVCEHDRKRPVASDPDVAAANETDALEVVHDPAT
jgi:hypothetical protein